MNFILQPWQLLFVVFCRWVHRRQTEIIKFQDAEIKAVLQQLGRKRILLTDAWGQNIHPDFNSLRAGKRPVEQVEWESAMAVPADAEIGGELGLGSRVCQIVRRRSNTSEPFKVR